MISEAQCFSVAPEWETLSHHDLHPQNQREYLLEIEVRWERASFKNLLEVHRKKSIKNEGLNFWKMDEAAKTIKHCFRYQGQDISSILPPAAVQM